LIKFKGLNPKGRRRHGGLFYYGPEWGDPGPEGGVDISVRLRVILKVSIDIVPQFAHIVPKASDHDHQGLGLLMFMLRPRPVPLGHDSPGDDDDQDTDGTDDLADLG
jgi:hypothetical protein